MKRCPECGFRADDRICPLCGVRMQGQTGVAREIKTHTHKQTGERCALPNQEREPVRPTMRKTVRTEKKPERKTPQVHVPAKLIPVLIVLLFTLLRSCMG